MSKTIRNTIKGKVAYEIGSSYYNEVSYNRYTYEKPVVCLTLKTIPSDKATILNKYSSKELRLFKRWVDSKLNIANRNKFSLGVSEYPSVENTSTPFNERTSVELPPVKCPISADDLAKICYTTKFEGKTLALLPESAITDWFDITVDREIVFTEVPFKGIETTELNPKRQSKKWRSDARSRTTRKSKNLINRELRSIKEIPLDELLEDEAILNHHNYVW